VVDRAVAHPARALLLVLPVGIHQLGEPDQVAGLERLSRVVADLLDEVQVGGHPGVLLLALAVLLLEDRTRRPRVAGEEEEEVVFQVVEGVLVDLQGPGLDPAVGQELEASDAPERGAILVLLADRLLEEIELDAARLFGQLAGMDRVLVQRVQHLEKGRGEAARRSQARPGRDVGHAGDLQRAAVAAEESQRLPDQGVLDLLDPLHLLHLCVLEQDLRHESSVDCQVNILIDRGRHHEAAVVAIIGRQVGSPAAERDAERTPGDDHDRLPWAEVRTVANRLSPNLWYFSRIRLGRKPARTRTGQRSRFA
jgi:hypothetical protein